MYLADSASTRAPTRPAPRRTASPRLAAWWRWGLATALCVALGVFVHHASYDSHLAADKRAAARRAEFFALSLEALLARNAALPGLMALEGGLAALLDADGAATRDAANRYLEAAVRIADVSAAYVMNADSLTLAASNWRQPITFVGQRYAFRPYFQDAIASGVGRFYGIGATTGEAGYFLASRIETPRGTQGVITVKVALEPFEQAMRQSGEAVFVADREGVILLSAEADWKYRVLQPMSARTLERLKATRQYGSQDLRPLVPGVAIVAQRDAPHESLRLARDGAEAEFSLTAQPVGPLGWRMVMLTDRSAAKAAAAVAGSAAALGAALLVGLFMYLRLWRRRREERLAAQQALEAVHDSLEARIVRRTAEVTAANRALEERVATLKQTEEILRRTRDSAVQAGKLAVLGQMSVGMSHELNQPLAALHTLSDNAVLLLDKNRTEETKENLALISQLAARMGRIVRQLKAFARKEPAPLGPVAVGQALEHALMLVDAMRQALRADIVIAPLAPGLRVKADAVRLEQVLVNLVRNGLEAMAGLPAPVLRIHAERMGDTVVLVIRDMGPGIAGAALPHLFEPFFTTKPVGQGLGLGLALSLVIVEGFGGRLEGRNAEDGGAEFRVVLEAA